MSRRYWRDKGGFFFGFAYCGGGHGRAVPPAVPVAAPVVAPVVARPVDGAAGVEGSVVPGVVGVGDAVALTGDVDVVAAPGAVVAGAVDVVAPAEFIVAPGLVLAGLVEPMMPELEPDTHGVLAPGDVPMGAPPAGSVAGLLGSVVPGEAGVVAVPGTAVPVVAPALGLVVPVGTCEAPIPAFGVVFVPTPVVVFVPTPVVVLVPTPVVVFVPTPVVVFVPTPVLVFVPTPGAAVVPGLCWPIVAAFPFAAPTPVVDVVAPVAPV